MAPDYIFEPSPEAVLNRVRLRLHRGAGLQRSTNRWRPNIGPHGSHAQRHRRRWRVGRRPDLDLQQGTAVGHHQRTDGHHRRHRRAGKRGSRRRFGSEENHFPRRSSVSDANVTAEQPIVATRGHHRSARSSTSSSPTGNLPKSTTPSWSPWTTGSSRPSRSNNRSATTRCAWSPWAAPTACAAACAASPTAAHHGAGGKRHAGRLFNVVGQPDRRARPRGHRPALSHPPDCPALRRTKHQGRDVRDGRQGHRFGRPFHPRRQDGHLRRRRCGQNGRDRGGHRQRRPSSIGDPVFAGVGERSREERPLARDGRVRRHQVDGDGLRAR